jgi:cobalt-zinc-cadmium efflux system protein
MRQRISVAVDAPNRPTPVTDHQPRSAAGRHQGRLRAVFVLAIVMFIVQLAGGIATGSLALLADAGHNLTDVVGIGLALLAIWIAGRPASGERTFGFLRIEILAAVGNAALLLVVAIAVLVESWRRWSDPPEVASVPMLVIALIGLAANAASIRLLRDAQRESLNIRGAYLEVVGDLAGSVAVIVAAVVITLTGWSRADAVASAVIGLLILPRTFALLRDAVDVLLEATPKGVDLDDVRRHILEASGVADVHDLHAWTITSGMNVVSAHVVLRDGADPPVVLDELCRCLSGDFDIDHSTFQLETADRRRLEDRAHA